MALIKLVDICATFLILNFVFTQVQAIYCRFDSDCEFSKYCCVRKYEVNVCQYNCIGESCFSDSSCASGETCCKGSDKCATSCVGESCSYNGDCATGETCCTGSYPSKCATSCVGESCSYSSDCATGETCCTGSYPSKCATSCVGESCSYNGNCATGETCCKGSHKCDTSCVGESIKFEYEGWISAVVVLGIIVVIGVPGAIVVFCYCSAAGTRSVSARRLHENLTQPNNTGTAVLANQHQARSEQGQAMCVQNSQPYLNQPPPLYEP